MARPPISAWREHETADPSNPLEKSGEISQEFWEARTSLEPRELQQEDPVENQRPTSLSKAHIEKRADSALDQTHDLKPEFDSVNTSERSTIEERASSMIEEDQPELKPRPTNELAERADRVSFDDRWEREQKAANQDQGLER